MSRVLLPETAAVIERSHRDPMRILFVTHNFPRFEGDAAGSFVLRLAVSLQDLGATVAVIAPGAPGVPEAAVLEGVHVRRVRYGSDSNMNLAYQGTMAETVRGSWRARVTLLSLLRTLRSAAKKQVVAARAEGKPYHVVHAHWWFPSALAIWRAFPRSELPMVITMHGSDVRLAMGVPPARALMRSVLERAAKVTAVSSWLADAATRVSRNTRIMVEPMPVDVRHFQPRQDGERVGVLFVGRLNKQKGLSTLLDAMALPQLENATLEIVGDGPDERELRGKAAKLGLDGRINWNPSVPQPELVDYYRQSAVVAIPSTNEGLGLVAVEAQLCETPVVAFASGGIPDVVRMNSGGTLVQENDVDAFAEAISRLLKDEILARREGELARRAMLAHFSPAEVGARYLELYKETVS